jgi:hypothetical protein
MPHTRSAMPDETHFIYSIEVPANEPIEFERLPKLLADAIHQTPFLRTAAAISFENELIKEIQIGKLAARNSLTLAKYPGAFLELVQRSVILPSELAPILAERGIRLVLTTADPANAETSDVPAVPDQLLKRSALLAKYEPSWPTIDRDLRDADKNGLRKVAHSGKRGLWWEEAARAWATMQGKLRGHADGAPKGIGSVWGHRIE